MDCPKCQFGNREGVKFCEECGAKLELICSESAAEIPLGHKFCGECGHPLTAPTAPPPADLTADDKLAKIQRYLPQGLADKILSHREKIEGERKQITVMFCDLEGFTPLSEKLGPEEAFGLVDPIYEILILGTHEYGGTVNEMTGDGIMALFGAPVALEDAPQRAIRAALAIHHEMVRFNDKMKQDRPGLPTLKMRIGIHTGPVVVGTLGNDLRVEFKAVGDTVNLASRVEGLAEPGTTYVSGETFQLTEGLFRFEGLGEQEVKGKEEPVPIYRVIAPSTRRTRFDVAAERGLTPFVGRQRELELLLDALDRAKSGQGQAVSIVAPAGDGKSRHLYEFRKLVANEDVTFLEGKCLSYSRGVAYQPVIDILKANFDIRDGDGESTIRDKVQRGLKVLKADDGMITHYLLELLSVKESGIDLTLSPEARKDRTIQALNSMVLKGAEIRPLILVVEDLHWMDQSSEDAFKSLLESIAGARVLLLFTYRPEYVHTWSGRSYHSQVTLNRLSNRETFAMATHLLGTEQIAENLANLIFEKTEGVPFFVEEFLKSLRERNLIERGDHGYVFAKDRGDATIPSTIQDVLMVRVDTLPEVAKEVLQTSAVIEREFPYALIERVTTLPGKELLSGLSALKDAELLYERGVFPESTYVFKHALTREVVYDSVLSAKKKQLHEAVGEAIEELYPDALHDRYEVLFEHFLASENDRKAATYARLAGRRAEQNGLFVEAVPYGEKAVACLERLPAIEEVQREIIDVRTTLALYVMQMGDWTKAKAIAEPIVDLATKLKYLKRVAQINILLGVYENAILGNAEESIKYLTTALTISKEINHRPSIQLANYWLGGSLWSNCEFERSAAHYGKALEINIEVKSFWGIVSVKSTQAMLFNSWGKVDLAYEISRETLDLAKEHQDIYSESFACTYYGESCFRKGLMEEAVVYLQRGLQVSERINGARQMFNCRQYLAEAILAMGSFDKSIEFASDAIRTGEQFHYAADEINCIRALREVAKIRSDEKNVNLRALCSLESRKSNLYEGSTRRNIGCVLLYLGENHLSEAEEWFERAIDADEKNGMRWNLATDYLLYGECFQRKGDRPHARQNLDKAREVFQECGADGWVTRTEEKLAEL